MSVYEPSPIRRRRRTKVELEELDTALADVVEEVQPATVRQVFYQAVVLGLVPKDEARGYKLVQRRLVALRERGAIPHHWITDNVRIVRGHDRYRGPEDYARVAAEFYRRDYWAEAPVKTDSRARKFMRQHGTGSVELDAIPPARLRGLVRDSIERHMDPDRLRVLKLAEEQERDVLRSAWGAA